MRAKRRRGISTMDNLVTRQANTLLRGRAKPLGHRPVCPYYLVVLVKNGNQVGYAVERPLPFLLGATNVPLGPFAVGDVAVVGDNPRDVRIVQEVLPDGLDVPPRTIGASQTKLERDRRPGLVADGVEESPLTVQVVGVDDGIAKDVSTDPVLRPISEQPFNRGGVIQNRALRIEKADNIRGVLDQGAKTRLAGAAPPRPA